jgi:hypothetical protein
LFLAFNTHWLTIRKHMTKRMLKNCLFTSASMLALLASMSASAEVIQRGEIFMRPTKMYEVPKPAPEIPLEERVAEAVDLAFQQRQAQLSAAIQEATRQVVERDPLVLSRLRAIAKETVTASDADVEAAIYRVAQQSVADAEASIRQLAREEVTNPDDAVYAAIRQVAEESVINRNPEVDRAIHDVAQRTLVNADTEARNTIRDVVNQTLLESDRPVEYAVRGIVEDSLARANNDQIEYAVKQIARRTIAQSDDIIASVARDEISGSRDYIKQLAELTLLENADVIHEQAQLALIDGNPEVMRTFQEVARQEAQALDKQLSPEVEYLARLAVVDELQENEEFIQGIASDTLAAEGPLLAKAVAKEEIQANEPYIIEVASRTLANEGPMLARAIAQEEIVASEDRVRQLAQETIASLNPEVRRSVSLIAAQTLASDDPDVIAALRDAVRATVVEGDTDVSRTLQEYARLAIVDSDMEVRQALELLADEAIVERQDYIADVASQQLRVDEPYIREVANLEIASLDDRVREAMRQVAIETVAGDAEDINAKIAEVAAQVVNEADESVIASIQQYAQLGAEDGQVDEVIMRVAADTLYANEEFVADVARRLVTNLSVETEVAAAIREVAIASATEQDGDVQTFVEETARQLVTGGDEDILQTVRSTVQETVVGRDDQIDNAIRTVAGEVLADSENYLRDLTKEELESNTDFIQENARQVILGADDKVAFAIKTLSREADQEDLFAAAGTGNLSADGITMRAKTEPGMGYFPPSGEWIPLKDYKVILHEDNVRLQNLVRNVLDRAAPYTGPWTLKWKLAPENADILNERFSLDAEVPFENFASYLQRYVLQDRGVDLQFKLFDAERILVISD